MTSPYEFVSSPSCKGKGKGKAVTLLFLNGTPPPWRRIGGVGV